MLIFIVELFLVGLVALGQSTSLFFWGVKPNLTLVLILALGVITKSWFRRIILIVIGAFFLKFSPLINLNDFLFIATVLLALAILDYLPWRKIISLGLLLGAATFVLNLQTFDFPRFLIELSLNLGFALIVVLVLKLTYAKEAIP